MVDLEALGAELVCEVAHRREDEMPRWTCQRFDSSLAVLSTNRTLQSPGDRSPSGPIRRFSWSPSTQTVSRAPAVPVDRVVIVRSPPDQFRRAQTASTRALSRSRLPFQTQRYTRAGEERPDRAAEKPREVQIFAHWNSVRSASSSANVNSPLPSTRPT